MLNKEYFPKPKGGKETRVISEGFLSHLENYIRDLNSEHLFTREDIYIKPCIYFAFKDYEESLKTGKTVSDQKAILRMYEVVWQYFLDCDWGPSDVYIQLMKFLLSIEVKACLDKQEKPLNNKKIQTLLKIASTHRLNLGNLFTERFLTRPETLSIHPLSNDELVIFKEIILNYYCSGERSSKHQLFYTRLNDIANEINYRKETNGNLLVENHIRGMMFDLVQSLHHYLDRKWEEATDEFPIAHRNKNRLIEDKQYLTFHGNNKTITVDREYFRRDLYSIWCITNITMMINYYDHMDLEENEWNFVRQYKTFFRFLVEVCRYKITIPRGMKHLKYLAVLLNALSVYTSEEAMVKTKGDGVVLSLDKLEEIIIDFDYKWF